MTTAAAEDPSGTDRPSLLTVWCVAWVSGGDMHARILERIVERSVSWLRAHAHSITLDEARTAIPDPLPPDHVVLVRGRAYAAFVDMLRDIPRHPAQGRFGVYSVYGQEARAAYRIPDDVPVARSMGGPDQLLLLADVLALADRAQPGVRATREAAPGLRRRLQERARVARWERIHSEEHRRSVRAAANLRRRTRRSTSRGGGPPIQFGPAATAWLRDRIREDLATNRVSDPERRRHLRRVTRWLALDPPLVDRDLAAAIAPFAKLDPHELSFPALSVAFEVSMAGVLTTTRTGPIARR